MTDKPNECISGGQCMVSTGIHEDLTFGTGNLDANGFWEHGCEACARRSEIRDGKRRGSYWPFPTDDGGLARATATVKPKGT